MEMELSANDYKEAGNKKFSAKDFSSAIQDYSKAIGVFADCVSFLMSKSWTLASPPTMVTELPAIWLLVWYDSQFCATTLHSFQAKQGPERLQPCSRIGQRLLQSMLYFLLPYSPRSACSVARRPFCSWVVLRSARRTLRRCACSNRRSSRPSTKRLVVVVTRLSPIEEWIDRRWENFARDIHL